MERFYWLRENRLAGSSRPGGRWPRHMRSTDHDALDQDLRWLQTQRIGAILSLTETALDPDVIEPYDFTVLHLPIADLFPPESAQFIRALAFIDDQQAAGRAVLVHCLAGQGRTGSILAAHLIRDGYSAREALAELRGVCPGAVENTAQEAALETFARDRGWML